jgi:hypothetical protein
MVNGIKDLSDFYQLALKYEFITEEDFRSLLLMFSVLKRENDRFLQS